jgi:hypothetical protein
LPCGPPVMTVKWFVTVGPRPSSAGRSRYWHVRTNWRLPCGGSLARAGVHIPSSGAGRAVMLVEHERCEVPGRANHFAGEQFLRRFTALGRLPSQQSRHRHANVTSARAGRAHRGEAHLSSGVAGEVRKSPNCRSSALKVVSPFMARKSRSVSRQRRGSAARNAHSPA